MSSSTDFARGNAAFQKSDFKSAHKHYTNALKANPNNATVLDCRAATYQKLGKHKDALEDARSAIKLEPTQARGYLRMFKVLNAMNQKEKAQQILGVGLKRVPLYDNLYTSLKRLKTSKDIKTPIQNYWPLLPVELTQSIFLCLPLQDRVRSMRVCRYWHQFLRDTPAIWRDLTVTSRSDRITVNTVNTYLKRAGPSGVHTIALGTISFKSQRGGEPMKELLVASQRLELLDLTGWAASLSSARAVLKKNKTSLRYLNASDATGLNDYVCAAIEECDTLETLVCLNYKSISPTNLKFPCRTATSVKSFRFETELVDGVKHCAGPILRYLNSLPKLEYLKLCYQDGPSTTVIPRLILALPRLQQFRVSIVQLPPLLQSNATDSFSVQETKEIEQNSANIRVFSLSCQYFYDWEFIPVINGCWDKLQVLTLSGTKLTNQSIQHICSLSLPQLQTLELSKCFFSSAAMVSLINACPNLRNVALSDLPHADDRLMTVLAQCKHIMVLDISFSSKITGYGLRRVVDSCSSLERLKVEACSIDLNTIQHVRSVLGHSNCSFISAL